MTDFIFTKPNIHLTLVASTVSSTCPGRYIYTIRSSPGRTQIYAEREEPSGGVARCHDAKQDQVTRWLDGFLSAGKKGPT